MENLGPPEAAPTARGLVSGEMVFGRFVLTRQLGRGGMGVVWLARDQTLGCEVALKFLPDAVRWDPAALAALRRETLRSRELTHPGIVRIHDLHEAAGAAAISMEYMAGGSLHQLRAGRTPPVLATTEIAVWLPGLCAALDHAHAQGVVHRDLKPSNLLLAADGVAKISDFGIAQPLFETALRVSQWAPSGTLAYMSPQQHYGEPATTSDDIYALGATLYELLTGKPPFYTGNLAAQIERRPPESLAVRRRQLGVAGKPIPATWEKTIAACLAKHPEDRPATAGAVAALLRETAEKEAPRIFVTYYVTNLLRSFYAKAALGAGLAVGAGLLVWQQPAHPAAVSQPSAPVYASDATRALAAWNLDGDGQDASGRGLHLTCSLTMPAIDRHGRIGRAARLNGSSALTCEGASALRWNGAQPFTFALWIKPGGKGAMNAPLAASRAAGQGEHYWQLVLYEGRPHFFNGMIQVNNPDQVLGSDSAPADRWSHVAAVNDGRELRVYLNGREAGRAALTASRRAPAPERAAFYLGVMDKFSSDRFAGLMDDARLWRRALSAAEIAALADPAPAPRFEITRGVYTEKTDLPAVIAREFGAGAALADWDELRRWHADDVRAWADELGLVAESQSMLVQRSGQEFVEGSRHYFINRFNGRKPDYYLAHDELGGMALALGSWHGLKFQALTSRPLARSQVEQLKSGGQGSLTREFASGNGPEAAMLVWRREFSRGLVTQTAAAEMVLRDGRVLRAVCRAGAGDAFALALGDAARPQLAREIGATYDWVEFSLVLRRGRLEFRAVSGTGGMPLFQEMIALPDFIPADVMRLILPGVDTAELTVEE